MTTVFVECSFVCIIADRLLVFFLPLWSGECLVLRCSLRCISGQPEWLRPASSRKYNYPVCFPPLLASSCLSTVLPSHFSPRFLFSPRQIILTMS